MIIKKKKRDFPDHRKSIGTMTVGTDGEIKEKHIIILHQLAGFDPITRIQYSPPVFLSQTRKFSGPKIRKLGMVSSILASLCIFRVHIVNLKLFA